MKTLPFFLTAAALAVASIPALQATFLPPTPTPVDRIIKNTEAQLAKKPDDMELLYRLARVHYLAFSLQRSELGIYPDDDGVVAASDVAAKSLQGANTDEKLVLTPEEALKHAARGAELFQQVLARQPKHILASLGLASLLEEFSTRAKAFKDIPTVLAKHDGATIRQHYAVAFEQAWEKDRKEKTKGPEGLADFVSFEAAEAYLRSAKAEPSKLTDVEKEKVGKLTKAVEQLNALPTPNFPVTPLVFSVKQHASIDSLLAPEIAVDFDLRGFGGQERWPWLQAETGILVWDPKREGKITSAKQMFGSYSWQLFWDTGFDALAALDDDQDGWLREAELTGISVWFDRNQNAISDAGEVTPLASLEVAALACTALETEGRHPLNRHGVEFLNGSRVPLWDWVTEPLAPLREVAKK